VNKKYLLYGMGIANRAVYQFMLKRGIWVKVYTDGDSGDWEKVLDNVDIIIKSPGIFPYTPFLKLAREKNKEIIGDLELFYRFKPLKNIICVTGTNGKTTVCCLLHQILQTQYRVFLGGNIGIPLFSIIDCDEPDILIIEASSYMLDNTVSFHPRVAILLNLFPNHLDYHETWNNYCHAKKKILTNLTEEDYFIYNGQDIVLNTWAKETIAKTLPFALETLDEELLSINAGLIGQHNKANIQVAKTIAKLFSVNDCDFSKVLKEFSLPQFRLEKIWDKNGLVIYNDSKATNPLASKAALEAMANSKEKVIWIAGGKKRGDDYSLLKDYLMNVQMVYLWGENAEEFIPVLREQKIDYDVNADLEKILTDIINNHSQAVILFSPGAQSFDRFASFEERGEYFNKTVQKIFSL
jgi:UDP-N-acetylmuramoylalanine--D-glutamate ligase